MEKGFLELGLGPRGQSGLILARPQDLVKIKNTDSRGRVSPANPAGINDHGHRMAPRLKMIALGPVMKQNANLSPSGKEINSGVKTAMTKIAAKNGLAIFVTV
ncbi:MAG: hypothetical protein H0X43_11130 [Nitrosospira sp.]|nr:hypothetical protein [Nitrosospira sp.]